MDCSRRNYFLHHSVFRFATDPPCKNSRASQNAARFAEPEGSHHYTIPLFQAPQATEAPERVERVKGIEPSS